MILIDLNSEDIRLGIQRRELDERLGLGIEAGKLIGARLAEPDLTGLGGHNPCSTDQLDENLQRTGVIGYRLGMKMSAK